MRSFAVLSLLAFAASSSANPTFQLERRNEATTTIDLTRRETLTTREDGSVDLEARAREVSAVTSKYARNTAIQAANASPNSTAALEKRGTAILQYDGAALYSGTITVGTPPQSFRVYFDSAAADLALPSYLCQSDACATRNKYDYSATGSSTAVTTKVSVGSYWSSGSTGNGQVVSDTVTSAGKTGTGQTILALTTMPSSISARNVDGVMGLAYRTLSAAWSYSFPFILAQQGSNPYVGIRLAKTAGRSQITFGGYNRAALSGNLRWLSVTLEDDSQFKTYWSVGGTTLFVAGKATSDRSLYIFDTGTSGIIMPTDQATDFYAAIPGSTQEADGLNWSYPCSINSTIGVSFARITKQIYTIAASDFNTGTLASDPTRCIGAVQSADLGLGSAAVILGEVFFKSWYVAFDVKNGRVGIATPRYA